MPIRVGVSGQTPIYQMTIEEEAAWFDNETKSIKQIFEDLDNPESKNVANLLTEHIGGFEVHCVHFDKETVFKIENVEQANTLTRSTYRTESLKKKLADLRQQGEELYKKTTIERKKDYANQKTPLLTEDSLASDISDTSNNTSNKSELTSFSVESDIPSNTPRSKSRFSPSTSFSDDAGNVKFTVPPEVIDEIVASYPKDHHSSINKTPEELGREIHHYMRSALLTKNHYDPRLRGIYDLYCAIIKQAIGEERYADVAKNLSDDVTSFVMAIGQERHEHILKKHPHTTSGVFSHAKHKHSTPVSLDNNQATTKATPPPDRGNSMKQMKSMRSSIQN